ncbi:hypothetical protein FRB93_012992 [Tulasnella sp. JGI-2019a]|nr:hypothetical protein FRB93_012992 [Tulasnella sp. JGI-2019a]
MASPPRLARTLTQEELQIPSPEWKSKEIQGSEKEGGDDDQEEELAALLPGSQTPSHRNASDPKNHQTGFKPRFLALLGLSLTIAATITGLSWWYIPRPKEIIHPTESLAVLSNGTHPFARTVLLVSLDGLRADYINRNLTTHLHNISVKGLRAKWMKPIFPTLTFPNHWALMTGLYGESHGIVANTFFDPVTGRSFDYTKPELSWDASWWQGEPVWATAQKAGIPTANLMWPGPPTTLDGHSPDYYVPFKNHVPLAWKHDRIFEWLDLPYEQRPQLITVYEPSVDQVGHKYGPDSVPVNKALKDVDQFARDIHTSLAARNLSHIVDIIFVSDHGMVDTSDLRLVYMDDILGDGFEQIKHSDGWPSMGLRFKPGTNLTEMLRRLEVGAASYDPPVFDVYATQSFPASTAGRIDAMPERYHFSDNPRIAPIYVIPKIGWALTNRHEHLKVMNGVYEPRGNHGYDNNEPAMRAMFVADGPFTSATKLKQQGNSTPSSSTKPTIMEGFNNVEVYNLVCKLLNITAVAATNGTIGFWDAWLD